MGRAPRANAAAWVIKGKGSDYKRDGGPTSISRGGPPTGDQSWTLFLSAANFKGPLAYYIPEPWSKIGKLSNYPFIYGRGLAARAGRSADGAMEINTAPGFARISSPTTGIIGD
ncbi:MAG: hypothetical protein JSU94_14470 [Phycisphaerales bacterium]|nr:MAG: hypothetical protein JSU94_14470 [Phycisphaerales bacterium]